MVYEIQDEDVLEVVDLHGWRAVYAVDPFAPKPPVNGEPSVIVDLDFDDEVTAIRPPPEQLLARS